MLHGGSSVAACKLLFATRRLNDQDSSLPMQGACVPSLARELKSHKSSGQKEKNNTFILGPVQQQRQGSGLALLLSSWSSPLGHIMAAAAPSITSSADRGQNEAHPTLLSPFLGRFPLIFHWKLNHMPSSRPVKKKVNGTAINGLPKS